MAINTDSRGYQSLIKNGYTDEQITQMQNQVLEGQSAKDVVANTPAANPSQIQPKNTSNLVDPIAFRPEYNTGQYDKYIEGRDPTKLNNADINISQYGDDSSAKNYNNSALWGGENQKYTGENTLGSQIAYNPNATIAGLDPNYLYGQAAQMQNSQDANYIARRNDEIASALYNEGLTSIQDVAEFLSKQNQWDYSNENERQNTIMSVWKRIGQIAAQQNNNEGPANEPDPSKADQILSDNSGKIYGKVTAENGEPLEGIDTLEDANSVYKAMEEARVNNLKNMISMNPADIAELMISGTSPYSEQTLRDAQKYYPEFMAQIEAEKKKKLGQQNVNAMTSGSYSYVTSEMESKKGNIESSIDAMAQTYSSSTAETASTKQEIESAIATNQTANEASSTMEAIEKEAAVLKNRLKNLRQEATAAFKGDVPDYMVNAYINNKTQEIQNQLSILEDRYNAAYQRYTTQLEQEWKQKQYNLQLDELNLQKEQARFNRRYQEQQLDKSNYTTDESGNVWHLTKDENGNIYYEKVEKVQSYAGSGMAGAGLRNNNPGNIKDSDFGNVLGHDERGFAKFATPEDGFDALVEKIRFNQTNPSSRYYGKTIREYFRIYAPSSDGNNPDAYAKSVAKQLGVSIDTPISKVDPVKLAAAIAKHDSGYDYSTYGQFREGSNLNNTTSSFDINSIEVPTSVYQVIDANGKVLTTLKPESELGQKLAQQYRENMAAQMGTSLGTTSGGTLVADADGTSTAAYKIISADDGTPIYFRQRIYNLVPATLKNSEVELKNLYNTAKILYDAGYTADEAALVFYGIDPRQDKTGLLRPLVSFARISGKKLDDTFYGRLGAILDSGDTQQAVQLLENTVLNEKQAEQESDAIAIVDKIQQLELLLKNAESLTGPISKPLNKAIQDWYKNPKYAALAAAIDNVYGSIRNKLMGSNITEGEKELYTGMFPDLKDQVSTIREKLKATKNSLIKDVNAVRKRYGLPLINQYTLVDYGLRAELYKKQSTSQSSANI